MPSNRKTNYSPVITKGKNSIMLRSQNNYMAVYLFSRHGPTILGFFYLRLTKNKKYISPQNTVVFRTTIQIIYHFCFPFSVYIVHVFIFMSTLLLRCKIFTPPSLILIVHEHMGFYHDFVLIVRCGRFL